MNHFKINRFERVQRKFKAIGWTLEKVNRGFELYHDSVPMDPLVFSTLQQAISYYPSCKTLRITKNNTRNLTNNPKT